MIEIEFNPDFIDNERFFEGTSGQLKEDRLTGLVIFLDQFPLYHQIRQWLSTHIGYESDVALTPVVIGYSL